MLNGFSPELCTEKEAYNFGQAITDPTVISNDEPVLIYFFLVAFFIRPLEGLCQIRVGVCDSAFYIIYHLQYQQVSPWISNYATSDLSISN